MSTDTSWAASDDVTCCNTVRLPAIKEDERILDSSTITSKCDDPPRQRKRKAKRPYSPEYIIADKKTPFKKKRNLQSHSMFPKGSTTAATSGNEKPFSCDMCKSPYIVNPTRSRLPYTKAKRRPGARKVIDTMKQKVLVVCNACGLAMSRNLTKKVKQKKKPPTAEEKAIYVQEAISFAKALADSMQEPLVERFYCPVYKWKPCRCLQNYIMGDYDADNENDCMQRTLQLLSLLKEAKSLITQKDLPDSSKDGSETNTKVKVKFPRGAKLRRTQAFEEFVLSKRLYLRDKLGLCERACQKILIYSNNFLHKEAKSPSNKGPRLERTIGKNAAGALKPISELPSKPCCLDCCVVLASTHSKLLESWRQIASLGQRQARRVLAEMLTPTGGTKANCYKFISMVTGCSYTTISLVSEQMKRTKGDREPPEHGLKKLLPDQTKDKPPEPSEDEDDLSFPSPAELQAMDSQQARARLQHQRQKLERMQKRLINQQLQLEKQQTLFNKRVLPVVDSGSIDARHTVGYSDPPGNTKVLAPAHLLHILKLPTTSGLAAMPTARQVMSPPTISVMTSSGSFEPLGNISNISVSLPGSSADQATFSNVVIVPESSVDPSNLGTQTYTQCVESPVPVASYEVDVSSSSGLLPVSSSSTFQLFTVMDAPGNTLFHLN